MFFLFYGYFVYFLIIALFKQENFYFNINIYSIIFVMIIFCLTHFFFVVKFYFWGK